MRIDLFRSGSHTAMSGKKLNFSESDLQATASAYDPAVHEAPIVVGHPKHDGPAYGWVTGLHAEGGSLYADAGQVDPAFSELVESGRFKKVSASFYAPDSAANPTPGVYHLRHVGFLGAQPPAVKGLQEVHFADDEAGTVTVEFGDADTSSLASLVSNAFRGIRDWLIGKYGQEEADRALPAWNDQWAQEIADKPEAGALTAFAELAQTAADAAASLEAGAAEGTQAASSAEETLPAGGAEETDPGGAAETQAAGAAAETQAAGAADETQPAGAAEETQPAGATAESVAAAASDDALPPADAAAAFAEREAKLQADETAFAERQATARKTEDARRLDDLVKAGKLAPGWRAPVADFLERLDADDTVSFGESAAETAHDFMVRLLNSGGTVIEFGEASAPGPEPKAGDKTARLARRARELVHEAKGAGADLSFAEAVGRAEREEEPR